MQIVWIKTTEKIGRNRITSPIRFSLFTSSMSNCQSFLYTGCFKQVLLVSFKGCWELCRWSINLSIVLYVLLSSTLKPFWKIFISCTFIKIIPLFKNNRSLTVEYRKRNLYEKITLFTFWNFMMIYIFIDLVHPTVYR